MKPDDATRSVARLARRQNATGREKCGCDQFKAGFMRRRLESSSRIQLQTRRSNSVPD